MGGFPPRRWGRPRIEPFTIEPHAVQVTWVGLEPGPVRVQADERGWELETDGGPGGLVVDGLEPDSTYAVRVEGVADRRVLRLRTPSAPRGAELSRLATVSDVHIGSTHFGVSKRMRERDVGRSPSSRMGDPGTDHLGRVPGGQSGEPHPLRCGRAALAEASAWGAGLLVVKGDLVESGRPDEWEAADRLLTEQDLPVAFVPGNHEVRSARDMDPPVPLPLSGVEMVTGVDHRDLPGLRIILVNSTIDGRGHGAVLHLAEEVASLATEADGSVLVAMHQHAQRFAAPWFWPPGIPGTEARAFLDVVERAAPGTVVTSGHTHRNRMRRHRTITVTEVGSTKDFPGVWAGYTAYEGGLVQTVRRTLSPEAMAWSEYTRRAVLGVWGRWAPGTVADRCVVIPRRR